VAVAVFPTITSSLPRMPPLAPNTTPVGVWRVRLPQVRDGAGPS
jgi:hypothetical protein